MFFFDLEYIRCRFDLSFKQKDMTTTNAMIFKTKKTYFRGNARFGRSTQLLLNGVVVGEYLGVNSKTECVQRYFSEQRMKKG